MTISEYKAAQAKIEAEYVSGWISYADRIQSHMKLKREYLCGKTSFLMPV